MDVEPLPRNDEAWRVWRDVLKSPRYVMAPMVDGSELPFRALCRRYGVDLCYSPMVQACILLPFFVAHNVTEPLFDTEPSDRPLVFQISGNDPDTVLAAAKTVEDRVDAVDLNLGCPQLMAKRACYGAYLMHEPEVVERVVRALATGLRVPVFCKIRVFPNVADTVAFAQMLQRAGCSLLTVHGRTKEQRSTRVGHADWSQIAAVKRALGIPVLLNGNVSCLADADEAMRITKCDGVMSAWGLLCNPRLFAEDPALNTLPAHPLVNAFQAGHAPSYQLELAHEYLEFSQRYEGRGGSIKRARLHLFRILGSSLEAFPEIRDRFAEAYTYEELLGLLDELAVLIRDWQPPPPPAPVEIQAPEEDVDESANGWPF